MANFPIARRIPEGNAGEQLTIGHGMTLRFTLGEDDRWLEIWHFSVNAQIWSQFQMHISFSSLVTQIIRFHMIIPCQLVGL